MKEINAERRATLRALDAEFHSAMRSADENFQCAFELARFPAITPGAIFLFLLRCEPPLLLHRGQGPATPAARMPRTDDSPLRHPSAHNHVSHGHPAHSFPSPDTMYQHSVHSPLFEISQNDVSNYNPQQQPNPENDV